MSIAIRTQELCKKFKQRTAVQPLDLDIQQGEFFALLGENGAGKTTTIKMLSCLLEPTSGDAQVGGHSILTEPEQVKQCINVSPQETAIAANLTVRENLMLIAGIYGFDKEQSRQKTEAMMKLVGIEDRAKDYAKRLSGGVQRRLSVAMALITDPEILFLDEPTLGLDVRARRELWKIIAALKGKVTVILTTHYLEEAEALADRICIMQDGYVKALGTLEQLKDMTGCGSLEDAFIALCDVEAIK